MRRSGLALAMTVAVVLGLAVPAMADQIVGELIDNACLMSRGAAGRGEKHTKCALSCAQKGHRLSVVTANGDAYVVTGLLALDNNARLLALIGKTVVITGTVRVEDVVAGEELFGPGGEGSTDLASVELSTATVEIGLEAAAGREDNKHKNSVRDGEVIVQKIKTGGFREGDARAGTVKIIDAIDVALPPKR